MVSRADHQPEIEALQPPPSGVAIRMYRVGLGDCFLLAFARPNNSPAYVLIDCGVHKAQTRGPDVMQAVVADIIRTTGGELNIAVATHEHTDHLSGFLFEAKAFLSRELKIHKLWRAWTENLADEDAEKLRRGRRSAEAAIRKTLERLQNNPLPRNEGLALRQRLEAARSYFEVEDDKNSPALAAAADILGLGARESGKVTANELAFAVLERSAAHHEFLNPGQGPIEIGEDCPARAYVLGPPRDLSRLKRSDPSAGARRETYLSSIMSLDSLAAAVGADDIAGQRAGDRKEMCFPFDANCRQFYSDKKSPELKFIDDVYGLNGRLPADDWRKIESDWLFASDELALQLDKHTNNTSLVLAFELGSPRQGPVLLFAADAQVGSWLSWKDLQWQSGRYKVDMADLFRRTILYKVGHHASHNGTLRCDEAGADYGLQLIRDGLIALVPVDQKVAAKLPGWDMPYRPLYEVLKQKTRGNILRSDDGHDEDLPLPRVRFDAVPGVAGARWRCSKSANPATGKPLFYDIEIKSPQ